MKMLWSLVFLILIVTMSVVLGNWSICQGWSERLIVKVFLPKTFSMEVKKSSISIRNFSDKPTSSSIGFNSGIWSLGALEWNFHRFWHQLWNALYSGYSLSTELELTDKGTWQLWLTTTDVDFLNVVFFAV